MNLTAVLDYLRTQQLPDGSFPGFASPTLSPFIAARSQPTIFPTILILDSLHDVVGAEDIRLRAAKYVERQVSEQGSWNYWEKTSQAKLQEPYPDDLDDTACALAALARADAKWVSGFRLGQFTRLLVAAETKPSGPYNTWLIDSASAPQWRQVDVAVNANIGYALSLQSVQVTGLSAYLDAALQTNALQSAYYLGHEPVLYFMSRWYEHDRLRARLTETITQQDEKSALQQALLLSAGCKVGVAKRHLTRLADSLNQKLMENHWEASALYIDPVYEGVQHYGGSAALTTAFALEALTAYMHVSIERPAIIARKRGVPELMKLVKKDAHSITNMQLRRRYIEAARSMMSDVAGDQIAAPATLMARAGGWNIRGATLEALNAASLNGWIAYTLQDSMLDGDAGTENIPLANVAYRRSYQNFLLAVSDYSEWQPYVARIFDTIDSANQWERRNARARTTDSSIRIRRMPEYGDFTQLAERSLGHGLAATAVMTLHYKSLDHPQVQAAQSFFKHFLIARQLNDDAHDWEEDLRAGRLTAVTTMLIQQGSYNLPCTLSVDDDLDKLRQFFWQHTISEVAVLIRTHLHSAQHNLDTLNVDTGIFTGWLEVLETSVAEALNGRDEALQFIQAYGEKYV